jgi:hypothetical protein
MSVTENVDRFGYIPIGGLALTVSSPVLGPAKVTGPLKGSVNTDLLSFEDAKQINVNLSVTALTSGASLKVTLIVLDPLEPTNVMATVPLVSPPISSPTNVRLVLTELQAQAIVGGVPTALPFYGIPLVFQLALTVGGVSPTLAVVGTYEVSF